MHPAIPRLVDLQQLDQQIAALRAEFDGLPKRFLAAEGKLTGAKSAVTAAKEAHTQALTKRKKLELDVEQWKDRAKKYREQSSSVKTNEAYKALLQEIANAEREAGKLEDLVLDQMMAVEEIEHRVKHAEADLKESETAIAAEKKQIELQYNEKKKKLEVAAAQRTQLAAKVPEELLELYTRISRKHPGAVMAEVRDDQCRGCGMRVLPHTVQVLRTETNEEVFRCETCGCILYTLEPIPRAAPPPDVAAAPSGEKTQSE
jgi:predicted  nucleic acid-binding Zn-ribbon protein